MAEIGHDPFARGSFRGECQPAGKCAWCGQHRLRLFCYVWVGDDRQCPSVFAQHMAKRHFCNFGCFESYFS
jgi:hypothetical protein